jgi:hypothetical protein
MRGNERIQKGRLGKKIGIAKLKRERFLCQASRLK